MAETPVALSWMPAVLPREPEMTLRAEAVVPPIKKDPAWLIPICAELRVSSFSARG